MRTSAQVKALTKDGFHRLKRRFVRRIVADYHTITGRGPVGHNPMRVLRREVKRGDVDLQHSQYTVRHLVVVETADTVYI